MRAMSFVCGVLIFTELRCVVVRHIYDDFCYRCGTGLVWMQSVCESRTIDGASRDSAYILSQNIYIYDQPKTRQREPPPRNRLPNLVNLVVKYIQYLRYIVAGRFGDGRNTTSCSTPGCANNLREVNLFLSLKQAIELCVNVYTCCITVFI